MHVGLQQSHLPKASVSALRSQNPNLNQLSLQRTLALPVQEPVVKVLEAVVDVEVAILDQQRRPLRNLTPRWLTTGRAVQMPTEEMLLQPVLLLPAMLLWVKGRSW